MLGIKLKKVRQDNGLSMDALSRIFQAEYGLNVTKSMISRWENNLAEPTNKYVSAYAKYFGLDMNKLLGINTTHFNSPQQPIQYSSILLRAQKDLPPEKFHELENMAEFFLEKHKKDK